MFITSYGDGTARSKQQRPASVDTRGKISISLPVKDAFLWYQQQGGIKTKKLDQN